MLTAGLEAAIQKGIAQYKTFSYGTGGVGRIPVPKGSFIIITDFDYFHFIDTPEEAVPGTPAESILIMIGNGGVQIYSFDINGFPGLLPSLTLDPGDVGQSTVDLQNFLDIYFPGFTVVMQYDVLALRWDIIVTTSNPGTAYNGIVPAWGGLIAPVMSISPFAGGSDPLTSVANIIANSKHQLEFRSTKSRNHYIIQEDWELFSWEFVTGNANQLFYNVRGMYHRDCYLVHTGSVQVNVLRVPPLSAALSIYSPLPNSSQENNLPVGYGQGVLPSLRRAAFAAGEFYFPLTPEFDPTGGGAVNVSAQDQFKVNAVAGRELVDPTLPLVGTSNGRNYPIVNIGYVLINKDYNDFVKSS